METYPDGEWEALAEVNFLLEGLPSYHGIICTCTRSMMRDYDRRQKFDQFFCQVSNLKNILGYPVTSSDEDSDGGDDDEGKNRVSFGPEGLLVRFYLL